MKNLLKANALMGMSTVITILSGIMRSKMIALLIGPSGLGLYGLLQSTLATAAAASSLGMNAVTVRAVAPAVRTGDHDELVILRASVVWTSVFAGLLGACVMCVWREPVAKHALEDPKLAWMVIILGVFVVVQNMATLVTSWINGFGESTRVAKVYIATALGGAIFGIMAVAFFGVHGVIVAVLGGPLSALCAGCWQVRALELRATIVPKFAQVRARIRAIVPLGISLTLGAVVEHGSNLWMRAIITSFGGKEAVGLFHASSSVAAMYIGFLLSAMTVDFFPRLSAATDDSERNKMINEQLYVAWLLILPLVLMLYVCASEVMYVLYSSDFMDAQKILRWQLLGDIFKMPCWAIGYLLLARNKGKIYLATQTLIMSINLGVLYTGLPLLGLQASGISFLVAHMLGACVMLAYARLSIGFRFDRRTRNLAFVSVACVFVMAGLEHQSVLPYAVIWQALMAILVGSLCAFILLREFKETVARVPFLGTRILRLYERFGW